MSNIKQIIDEYNSLLDRISYLNSRVEQLSSQILSNSPDPCPKCSNLRSIIIDFANIMEYKLKLSDNKSSFSTCTSEYLIHRLQDEVHELINSLHFRSSNYSGSGNKLPHAHGAYFNR